MILSLRIKLILSVVLVVSLILDFFSHYTISKEREILEEGIKERAVIISSAFDTTIFSFKELRNIDRIQSNIYKFL